MHVRWPAVKAAFDACAPLPAAARIPVLATLALDDAERDELLSLLARHDAAGDDGTGLLDRPAAAVLGGLPAWTPASMPVRAGTRLGAWEVVRPIGRGGMGEVHEVRRADGAFDGRAAAKLLRAGLDGAAVLRRFARERQALARLNHPHIARLLDAGVTDDGRPWFVMERVDGRPIDEVALGRPLAARLELFLQLADAVAHAHRHLLLHRDLKPGNVLVDAADQVKLLDFGIAKALDRTEPTSDGEPDGGATTVAGDRPFTPSFAAPEQVRGEPAGMATDVHGLGVLLHLLVTGVRPTGRGATTPQAQMQAVLDEVPAPPSRLGPGEVRDPQWPTTRRAVAGDLDMVILKALEKDPGRRYGSVDALAADVRAVREGRPVTARAAGPLDRALKVVRRHRAATAAGAFGAVGLVAGLAAALADGRWLAGLGVAGLGVGLAATMAQARRAEAARTAAERHADALRRLSRELVVGYGDAVAQLPGGREQQARLLGSAIGFLERLVGASGRDDPGLLAELAVLHGRLATLRGRNEFNAVEDGATAVHHARRAVALAQAAAPVAGPAVHVAWAEAHVHLSRAAQYGHRLDEARSELDAAGRVLADGLVRFPGDVALRRHRAQWHYSVAALAWGWDRPSLGDAEAALVSLRQGADELRSLVEESESPEAEDVSEVGGGAAARAMVLLRLQRWTEALAAAREAEHWRARAAALQPHHRLLQGALVAERNLVAGLSLDVGDTAGALAASEPAWASITTLVAEDPENTAWVAQRRWLAFHHGRALLAAGRTAQAQAVLAVSCDWLSGLAEAGTLDTRQRVRLARTLLALADAATASGEPGDGFAARAAATLAPLTEAQRTERDAVLAFEALARWSQAGPVADAA